MTVHDGTGQGIGPDRGQDMGQGTGQDRTIANHEIHTKQIIVMKYYIICYIKGYYNSIPRL